MEVKIVKEPQSLYIERKERKTTKLEVPTKKLGYGGIDQYGKFYHINKHPRKELLEELGAKHCEKMYADTVGDNSKHIGYIITGHWIMVYEIHTWDGGKKS